jgi:DNA repair exonuclease SbcCD ATPase subunit
MKDIDTERSNIDKTLSQLIGQSEIYEMFAQVLMKIGPRREEEYKCPLCESELARERYETLGKNLQNKINKFKTDISSFKVKLAEVKILYERLLAEHTTILNVLPRAEIYIKRAKSMQEITERNMSLSNKYSEISEELEKLNREQDELIKKLDSNVRLYEQTNADLKGPTVTKVFNTLVNKSRNRLICELFSKSFDKTLQNQKNIYFQKVVNTLNKELSRFRMEEKYLVHIDDNGIPNVEVDNRNREFTHLSSGERTATYILTRMLLNNFIAKGDFIILDEPFEHLDIDNKKYLRDFIADAYKSNYMEQVIITTIQETLTRAFLQDSNTHLLYLR